MKLLTQKEMDDIIKKEKKRKNPNKFRLRGKEIGSLKFVYKGKEVKSLSHTSKKPPLK